MKQIITISRQYGSGGRIIGKLVAEKLGVPFFDKEVIDLAVEKSGFSREMIESAELKAKSSFAYSLASTVSFGESVTGGALSVNEKLFLAQFDVIKKIGETEEGGVIVGRCADYVLRDMPGVTNVFVCSEMPERIQRCVEKYGDDPAKVKQLIHTYDKARQNYYNYHTCQKWGDYHNYNMVLNTCCITEEMAADIIVDYVNNRIPRVGAEEE